MRDIDAIGEARGDGESWAECVVRLRGPDRWLHPLVPEVFDGE